jgi:hypothetical protein
MYLAHYTKRFIPEFDAECRINSNYSKKQQAAKVFSSAQTKRKPFGFLLRFWIEALLVNG